MKLQKYILAWVALVIALAVFAIPAAADFTDVPEGGTVLLGEQGLDISDCLNGYDHIAYWGGLSADEDPVRTIDLSGYNLEDFDITGSDFDATADGSYWYQYEPGEERGDPAFKVVTPRADIEIVNLDLASLDITDGNAVLGSDLDFIIRNSTLQFIQQRDTGDDMDCDIEVINPNLLKYTWLYTPVDTQHDLTDQPIETTPYYWSDESDEGSDEDYSWETGKHDTSIPCNYYYPYGTYTVRVVCNENSLGFSGPAHGVTLVEDTLTLTISPPSVTRGMKFSSTIQGVPETTYLLWVKNCKPLTGEECDQPPYILPDQDDVIYPYEWQGCDFGETPIQCTDCFGCVKTVKDTVPDTPPPEGAYYVLVRTDEYGQVTVEWQTTNETGIISEGCDVDCWTFLIRAQRWEEDDCCEDDQIPCPHAPYKCAYDPWVIYDEATVQVCKGEFDMWTVVYDEQTDHAYLGEAICIRGINRDSCCTFLFIRGPCQSCPGNNLCCNDPVHNGYADTFTSVSVRPDGYWEYIWQTKLSPLDLGTYTIYAASKPNDAPSLECKPCDQCTGYTPSCAAWDKQNFTLLEPTLTADIHPKVLRIVCCEEVPIMVEGRATGIVSDTLIYHSEPHRICPGPGCPSYLCPGGVCQDIQESDVEIKPVPLAFWVFGQDKVAGYKYIFDVDYAECPTGNFSIDIADEINEFQLQPGEYKVVVQHPMYNHVLDIIPDTWLYKWYSWYSWNYMTFPTYVYDSNRAFVISRTPVQWSKLFQIDGPGRMVGMAAFNELIEGLDDQNVDDKYVVLNFKVESNTALRADFSGTPSTGAAPLTVEFTDISDGAPTTWLWSFGDGTTATERNPIHTYIGPGSYSVSLTVSSPEGSSMITKSGYITVTGVSPTVTPTPVPPSGSTINLYNGWNFISTPKTLADGYNTAGTVFGGVNKGGHSIYLYDAGTGLWQTLGNSSLVKPLDGIWIYSVGTTSVPLTYKNNPLETPPTKQLYAGWNAIGFSDTSAAAAKDALQSVVSQWTSAIGFNAASQSYETSIINGGSGSHSDSNPMYPTKGYWLFMSADGTLASISA